MGQERARRPEDLANRGTASRPKGRAGMGEAIGQGWRWEGPAGQPRPSLQDLGMSADLGRAGQGREEPTGMTNGGRQSKRAGQLADRGNAGRPEQGWDGRSHWGGLAAGRTCRVPGHPETPEHGHDGDGLLLGRRRMCAGVAGKPQMVRAWPLLVERHPPGDCQLWAPQQSPGPCTLMTRRLWYDRKQLKRISECDCICTMSSKCRLASWIQRTWIALL